MLRLLITSLEYGCKLRLESSINHLKHRLAHAIRKPRAIIPSRPSAEYFIVRIVFAAML